MCSVLGQRLTISEHVQLGVFLYHVLWFALNWIHDNGDEDRILWTLSEDKEFWRNTREMRNVERHSKKHRWGPPSANLAKFDRRQNVHIVERSSDNKKQLRRASRISSQPLNITHNTSPKPLLAERFRFSKTKLAWRRNCDYLLGRSEEASGPLQFWKKSINKKNYQAWREIMWATWQPEQKCYLGRFTSREETAEKMKLDTSSGEDEEM